MIPHSEKNRKLRSIQNELWALVDYNCITYTQAEKITKQIQELKENIS